MFDNIIKEIENFFEKHPVLHLLRLAFLVIALIIYIAWSNRFTVFLFCTAFLYYFLETALQIIAFVWDLAISIFKWKEKNANDIFKLPIYLFSEFMIFISILVVALGLSLEIQKRFKLYFGNYDSVSELVIINALIAVLITLSFTFILTYSFHKVYFRAFHNELGFKLIDTILIFFESIVFVLFLGFNGIVYEYIDIHKNFFVTIFQKEEISSAVAVLIAKGLYSSLIYGTLLSVTAFHIAFRIAYSSTVKNKELENESSSTK